VWKRAHIPMRQKFDHFENFLLTVRKVTGTMSSSPAGISIRMDSESFGCAVCGSFGCRLYFSMF